MLFVLCMGIFFFCLWLWVQEETNSGDKGVAKERLTGSTKQSSTVEGGHKMKKCPFCAEEIQDDAVKCRFCGEFLNQQGQQRAPTEEPQNDSYRTLLTAGMVGFLLPLGVCGLILAFRASNGMEMLSGSDICGGIFLCALCGVGAAILVALIGLGTQFGRRRDRSAP